MKYEIMMDPSNISLALRFSKAHGDGTVHLRKNASTSEGRLVPMLVFEVFSLPRTPLFENGFYWKRKIKADRRYFAITVDRIAAVDVYLNDRNETELHRRYRVSNASMSRLLRAADYPPLDADGSYRFQLG